VKSVEFKDSQGKKIKIRDNWAVPYLTEVPSKADPDTLLVALAIRYEKGVTLIPVIGCTIDEADEKLNQLKESEKKNND